MKHLILASLIAVLLLCAAQGVRGQDQKPIPYSFVGHWITTEDGTKYRNCYLYNGSVYIEYWPDSIRYPKPEAISPHIFFAPGLVALWDEWRDSCAVSRPYETGLITARFIDTCKSHAHITDTVRYWFHDGYNVFSKDTAYSTGNPNDLPGFFEFIRRRTK